MKKLFVLLVAILLVTACDSSADDSLAFDSNILVDGVEFAPTHAVQSNATANTPGEAALNFALTKGTFGTSGFESINCTVNYTLTSSSAPNGVYEFGIGVIGEVLFAQGSYGKGSTFYSLAGFTFR